MLIVLIFYAAVVRYLDQVLRGNFSLHELIPCSSAPQSQLESVFMVLESSGLLGTVEIIL